MAKKKRGDAHGGGHGWFVTFADLMGLMMSFFVMLVAFSTMDNNKLKIVAGSMRDAFGTTTEVRYSGIIESDGLPTRPKLKNTARITPEESSNTPTPDQQERSRTDGARLKIDREFALASASLRQALQDMPELAELSKNIIIDQTPEGLRIQLVDQEGRSMFNTGTAVPNDRAKVLLRAIAKIINQLPNRISIYGHTSATVGSKGGTAKGDWPLSQARADVSRNILEGAGVDDDRVYQVSGKATKDPLYPDDPTLPGNRRIAIVLLREAPVLPPDRGP
jgi:chemotaxis protein MotB